jgi:hypothetical protein
MLKLEGGCFCVISLASYGQLKIIVFNRVKGVRTTKQNKTKKQQYVGAVPINN